MSEPEVTSTESDDASIEAEVAELTASPSDQQAAKIQAALIAAKKGEKAAKKRNAELEPLAARMAETDERLNTVQPIINAILSNPKLRAEALRIANGTSTSHSTTEQPTSDEDPDAAAFAEIQGYYLADNTTPDLTRARRALDILDKRHGRQTDERIRPLAGVTLGQKADSNIRAVIAQTDDDGVPLATEESIREVVAQFGNDGQAMLANPAIVNVVLESAIGRDKIKKRTPKPLAEPMYLAPAGGRRSAQPVISADEKKILDRLGLTEKDYAASSAQLEKNVSQRRGTVLGS
jgi:hypothetical protein